MRTYLIAEIGTNHNGDAALAIDLAHAAISARADAIKVQMFEADSLVLKGTPAAAHAKEFHYSQYERMKSLELPDEAYQEISRLCYEHDMRFVVSPFSPELVEKAVNLGASWLKVASGELTNTELLKAVKETQKRSILSTGMATEVEIRRAVDMLEPMALMHCVSLYPTPPQSANLGMITRLREAYPTRSKAAYIDGLVVAYPGMLIGYSDHTAGLNACMMAVALGATVFEKHLKLSNTHRCADMQLSATPEEMLELRGQLWDSRLMLRETNFADVRMRRILRRGPSGLRGDYD